MVTLDIVFKVLHVPRVVHPNYPNCERLKTMSKDELMFMFCEQPSDLGDCENTVARPLLKVRGFLI